ncbi:MAG: hypothetical protein ACR2J8_04975, partial [Thermomicrobiales bacterium]
AKVTATWTYNNTDMHALSSETNIPAGSAAIWTSFSIEAPLGSAWPTGSYRVLVSIDGSPAAIGAVDVQPAS